MKKTREKSFAKEIVRAPSQGLAVRSAAIVTRGLRDLARDSNWRVKRAFAGDSARLAISPAGQVCAVSHFAVQGTERLAVYDIESGALSLALSVAGEKAACPEETPAALAWSPAGRHLVAAWGGWRRELHAFDLHERRFQGVCGGFSEFPTWLAWSETGKYFAAASAGGPQAGLRLWTSAPDVAGQMPVAGNPASELNAAAWDRSSKPAPLPEKTAAEAPDDPADAPAAPLPPGGETDEESFRGFGRLAFRPDEQQLAAVAEIEGDWADDSVVLLEMPALRKQNVFNAAGHITDVAWTCDSRQLIVCSAGQAFRVAPDRGEPEPLPFGAELCACHPHLPLGLCFSSWLKNSAKGRLFLVDLGRMEVFDERPAEGVAGLRWSADGSTAYAVTREGLAYIYEPPLL